MRVKMKKVFLQGKGRDNVGVMQWFGRIILLGDFAGIVSVHKII